MTAYKIGIDLGGTKTEGILLNPQNLTEYRERMDTPRHLGYRAIITSISDLIQRCAGSVPKGNPYSIGIGIPGTIYPPTGLVQNANTTCLIGKPFKTDLEDRIGRPICMENDANCFTLAECLAGAAKQYDMVFGIIMGTGCGGGLYVNGSVRKGPHDICGEWGHFGIDPQGATCYCGKKGCIETKISGSGVEKAYFAGFGNRLTMREIVNGYRMQVPECKEIFLQFLDDFGRSVGGLISTIDPDAIVIGGGLSNIDELYTQGVERIRYYAFHRDVQTPILKNRLGDSAGVFGAAWLESVSSSLK
jgi:fructokinase